MATARGEAARVHAQALNEVRSQQAVAQQVTRQAEAAISTAQEQARQAVQGTMGQTCREMSARDSAANLEIMSLREREAELQARLGEAHQEISQLRQAMSESQVRVATLEAGNGTDPVVGMMQSTLASFTVLVLGIIPRSIGSRAGRTFSKCSYRGQTDFRVTFEV